MISDGTGGSDDEYFDCDVYTQRIQVSAETFLLECQSRGVAFGKDVHAHVVGLGLGVWALHKVWVLASHV